MFQSFSKSNSFSLPLISMLDLEDHLSIDFVILDLQLETFSPTISKFMGCQFIFLLDGLIFCGLVFFVKIPVAHYTKGKKITCIHISNYHGISDTPHDEIVLLPIKLFNFYVSMGSFGLWGFPPFFAFSCENEPIPMKFLYDSSEIYAFQRYHIFFFKPPDKTRKFT